MYDSGYSSDCKQLIFMQGDPLNYLRRAGILWERRVRKSLNSMCTELEVTLQGQPRSITEKEELLLKWDELSNYQIGKSTFAVIEFAINWFKRISMNFSQRFEQLSTSLRSKRFIGSPSVSQRANATWWRVRSFWHAIDTSIKLNQYSTGNITVCIRNGNFRT